MLENFQGDSWGLIPPLRMPSLLPHDLCHGRSSLPAPNDLDSHDGVVTHLGPDILDCEVKWALGSITTNKASGSDGIQGELFQILKYDAVQVLYSMSANLEDSAVATGLEKSVFIPIPKKGNAKECSNYWTTVFISHARKGMLKILQARLQQDMNQEFPDVQAGFTKGRGTRNQIVNIHWIIEKAREFQKNIYFCFIDYAKALTVWITTNWKTLQEMEYQTTWPVSWEICMQAKKQ